MTLDSFLSECMRTSDCSPHEPAAIAAISWPEWRQFAAICDMGCASREAAVRESNIHIGLSLADGSSVKISFSFAAMALFSTLPRLLAS